MMKNLQLVFKPHFGIQILLFRSLGSSEQWWKKIDYFWVTFQSVFFNFSMAKIHFLIVLKNYCSFRTKKMTEMKQKQIDFFLNIKKEK